MWNSLADGLLLRGPVARCRGAGFLVYPYQVDLSREQRALEEQGFLVFVSHLEYQPGDVLPDLDGGFGRGIIPGPVVVKVTATYEEFACQFLKYYADLSTDPDAQLKYARSNNFRFYKVVAE